MSAGRRRRTVRFTGVLENDDTGWSKVRYITSDGTTIEGYVKSEYLAPVG